MSYTFEHIESYGPYCYAHHGFWVIEELDGLCVQGKVICVLQM